MGSEVSQEFAVSTEQSARVSGEAAVERAQEALGARRSLQELGGEDTLDMGQMQLQCGGCGAKRALSKAAEREESEGWPKCCGETMGLAAMTYPDRGEGAYHGVRRHGRNRRRQRFTYKQRNLGIN